jgi:hypothetical protein
LSAPAIIKYYSPCRVLIIKRFACTTPRRTGDRRFQWNSAKRLFVISPLFPAKSIGHFLSSY